MKNRKVMQMALEALEANVPYYLKDRGYVPIIALKAALEAEPVVMYPGGDAKFLTPKLEAEQTCRNNQETSTDAGCRVDASDRLEASK